MSATSMLTLIAFQFAMGDLLPRLSYFTINKESLALKMDRLCSWLFPLIFFVFVMIAFNI